MLYETFVGDNVEDIKRELERLKCAKSIQKDYYKKHPTSNLYLRIINLLNVINSLERKLKRVSEYF